MKVLLAISLLVICVSARLNHIVLDRKVAAVNTCNVSESKINGNFRTFFPERRILVQGVEYYDIKTQRMAIIGKEIQFIEDKEVVRDFTLYFFFMQYLGIRPRTQYFYTKDQNDQTRCDKFDMRDFEYFQMPGAPPYFTCDGNIVEGWLDTQRNDGVLLRYCTYASQNAASDAFRTVTDKGCYPVRHSEVKFDKFDRLDILEETSYFNWNSDLHLPDLEKECEGI